MTARTAVVLLALAQASCGAKTGLRTPVVHEDASMDAGHDAAPDAPMRDAPMADAWTPPDVCIELPPDQPPTELPVEFVARIESAEIFFLVDVTGSMAGEIDAIQARVVDTIAPGIAAQIPEVRFSVGHFADYPQDGFGSTGDEVFALLRHKPSADDAAYFSGDRVHQVMQDLTDDSGEAEINDWRLGFFRGRYQLEVAVAGATVTFTATAQ